MSSRLRLSIAQINPLVGDVDGNQALIADAIGYAQDTLQAEVLVFPELAICGYPPEDLLHRDAFIQSCARAITDLSKLTQGITVIVGAPIQEGRDLFNGALIIRDTQIIGKTYKQCLPNYGVFDEKRYFSSGNKTWVFELIPGVHAGVSICEDAWCSEPILQAKQAGADLMINLNASPFSVDKHQQRIQTMKQRAIQSQLPIVYVNQLGGQDELVFDGGSFVINDQADIVVQCPFFVAGCYAVDIAINQDNRLVWQGARCQPLATDEAIYQALVLGVKDYVLKNGFSQVVLGLSGGIDSALTLAIAVDALGADQVTAVMMPYHYTSAASIEDAKYQARQLGVVYRSIPIDQMVLATNQTLEKVFSKKLHGVTKENIQARSRGILLMAIANEQNQLVLTTGNKSELAVGYATLYGDMAGGFAPLKDVYKTQVYRLAHYRNQIAQVIPERVLTRAPSAELAPDQTDADSLPPYEVLDAVLRLYIEHEHDLSAIVGAGFDWAVVREVIDRVDANEYKRRQSPPGIKTTDKSFGRDRRLPITGQKSAGVIPKTDTI